MDSPLARIQAELTDALRRANTVAGLSQGNAWNTRPAPNQWSVAECLIHLNLTSRAFLPLIDEAISRGREQTLLKKSRYRMDLMGRILWMVFTGQRASQNHGAIRSCPW